MSANGLVNGWWAWDEADPSGEAVCPADDLLSAYEDALSDLEGDLSVGWNEDNCRAVYERRIRRLRAVLLRRLSPPPKPVVSIHPDDLLIESLPMRTTGWGVSVTASGIQVTHKPTGIVVRCTHERSQHRNRDIAIKMIEAALSWSQNSDTVGVKS